MEVFLANGACAMLLADMCAKHENFFVIILSCAWIIKALKR